MSALAGRGPRWNSTRVSDGGAPTGKWPTLPPHLQEQEGGAKWTGAKLVVRRPGVPEVEIPIEKEEFVIGRKATEVDLALDDDLVSRRHASLTVDARGYFKLQDLGSKNGITFSGRTVRRLNLVDGDEFEIGKTAFVFSAEMKRFVGVAPVKQAPPPRSESVFGDVDVPAPKGDASLLADAEDVGWDPSKASSANLEPPPEAAEEEEDSEESVEE